MKNEIQNMITNLVINENAKKSLEKINKIFNNTEVEKRINPAVLIVSENDNCEITEYSKVLSAIVDSSLNISNKKNTFIELTFPKDNEHDEKLFFASPKKVAYCENKNRFYGTFLISLREFSGQDLINSPSLTRLCDFIDCNKNNICFVIHITPDFSSKTQLIAMLEKYINVVEVYLSNTDTKKSISLFVSELENEGITVDKNNRKHIKENIMPFISSNTDLPNNLVSRLIFEKSMSDDESLYAGICRLNEKLRAEKIANENNSNKIGFIR